MVKLEVNDNFAKSAMDGSFMEITAELILGLMQFFMTFESDAPGTGHAMLKAVRLAIENDTIVEAAAETAAEAKITHKEGQMT